MYVKRLTMENVGPIEEMDYEMPFTAEGRPKPVVLVGGNGSGKSIVLSHIVNAILNAQQEIFEDCEVEKGKVYKYMSPGYIRSGRNYYFSRIEFEEELQSVEWQLTLPRDKWESQFGYTPNRKEWARIPKGEGSVFWSNRRDKRQQVLEAFEHNCVVYFPANRFEEPAWLNYANLAEHAKFPELKQVIKHSNRTVIQQAPLQENRDWLLDLLFDRHVFEAKTPRLSVEVKDGLQAPIAIFAGFHGPATKMYEAVIEVLRLTLQCEDDVRFGVGVRRRRHLSVMQKDGVWVPNVFQLSTGETSVLNLFMSILRDYDRSGAQFEGLEHVRGLVLIDEIDSHLHCDLQNKVLPILLKRFPQIQFIMSSHSPLFLLGLRRELSDEGFEVLALPECKVIGVERFAEFEKAYDVFRESSRYEDDLVDTVENVRETVVFVEGECDIAYLQKAAEVLGACRNT